MKLIEVNSKSTVKEFLQVPIILYKGDKHWIQPLDKDINNVFDPQKNKFFRHGEAIRWILKDEKENLIGRVAAFVHQKTSKKERQPTGGMGFFECINNQQAAFLLFDTCKQWLQDKGMQAMDGPINFGERDKWWGLLVDGFVEPNYCMPYHHPYYRALFEEYGFKNFFNQYTYGMLVSDQVPEKYYEKANRVGKDPAYRFENVRNHSIEQIAEDFRTIYNKAWVKHSGNSEIAKSQAMSLLLQIKPVMDKDIIWFGYYNNQPIAFFIMIPELNQLFKHLKGKYNSIAKLKFIWHKWRGTCTKMFGIVFGVVPEQQGKGVEGALITVSAKHIKHINRYTALEMNWVGDFNPKMIHMVESLGARVLKTHITYRKLFDTSAPFHRYPIIN